MGLVTGKTNFDKLQTPSITSLLLLEGLQKLVSSEKALNVRDHTNRLRHRMGKASADVAPVHPAVVEALGVRHLGNIA
jgi:hypothetical protein